MRLLNSIRFLFKSRVDSLETRTFQLAIHLRSRRIQSPHANPSRDVITLNTSAIIINAQNRPRVSKFLNWYGS